jgi:tungstate transport system substrate-binding protein
MRKRTLGLLCLLIAALAPTACGDDDDNGGASDSRDRPLILATTTSTQDSGLLDVLVPAFENETDRQVKTVAVGSGEAIELASRGEADVLLVHSPDDEEEFMASGKGGTRRIVMHNDFVIVGPPDDPAGIRGMSSTAALERIAQNEEAPFVSRGDDSGTHALELKLWDEGGVTPAGSWYQETGQGMGATLRIADQKRGYTIADRGTYLCTGDSTDLDVLVEGEPRLLNVYHVIDVDPGAGPRVNAAGGRAFADWIVSPAAQRMIGAFGRKEFGRLLFVPDAGKTEQQVADAA